MQEAARSRREAGEARRGAGQSRASAGGGKARQAEAGLSRGKDLLRLEEALPRKRPRG